MVGNDSTSKKTLFPLGCDLSSTPYQKKFGIQKKYNKTSFLYTSIHEKIYMDKDSLMPKKRKDLFINKSIVTNRKILKCNQMICEYMQLIVVDN